MQSVAKRCDPARPADPGYPGTSQIGANTTVALVFIGACSPYRAVMEILTQRDPVDGEIPQRGRARIAGSAIAARFGPFADCPASAGVPCHNGFGFCGDRSLGHGSVGMSLRYAYLAPDRRREAVAKLNEKPVLALTMRLKWEGYSAGSCYWATKPVLRPQVRFDLRL
jgi:hypothetical protein